MLNFYNTKQKSSIHNSILFSEKKKARQFMLIVYLADNLHEMVSLIFSEIWV